MVGIVLVTDPLERLAVKLPDDGQPLTRSDARGHLPNDLMSKLIGLILCIPSMFGQATECKSSHNVMSAETVVVSMRLVGDQATSAQMMVYLAFCPATVAAG